MLDGSGTQWNAHEYDLWKQITKMYQLGFTAELLPLINFGVGLVNNISTPDVQEYDLILKPAVPTTFLSSFMYFAKAPLVPLTDFTDTTWSSVKNEILK